jgi:signal transduction histidine kinase
LQAVWVRFGGGDRVGPWLDLARWDSAARSASKPGPGQLWWLPCRWALASGWGVQAVFLCLPVLPTLLQASVVPRSMRTSAGFEPGPRSGRRIFLWRAPHGRVGWSLRRELALLVLGVTFLPLVGFGALAYSVVARREADSALSHLDSVAAVQKARVEAVIYQNFQVALPLIQNDSSLSDLLAKFWESGSEADRAALAEEVSALTVTAPIIRSLVVLTPSGIAVVGSDSPRTVGNLSDFVGVTGGLQGNISGPLLLDSSSELVYVMAGPVVHDGKIVGMVMLETSTQDFVTLVSDYSGLGRTGETELAMADPQGDAVFITPLRFDPDAGLVRHISRSETSSPIVRAVDGYQGVLTDTVDYRGVRVFAATRYIPEQGWGIVVKMDRSEALSGTATCGRILLVGLCVIGAGAIVGGWLGMRAIRRPVLELTSTAVAVSKGDTTRRAAVRSPGEIGTLAVAFNEMTSALVETTSALEEERAVLERRVAERTSALEESAWHLADLLKSKADLVASISHELRTPLTVMVGFVTELTAHWDSFGEDERRELLGIAATQGAEVAGIIDDLLVAAQTEAGELSVRAEVVDLGPLATEVIEADRRGDSQPIAVSRGEASAWADPRRVRQILRNLFVNALRYGGPTIEVEMETSGGEVHLLVCDDGPGVAQDRWEQIFEMYDRNAEGTGKSGSIGIGLTISRRLARLMGGDLTYRYQAGRSVFDLRLLAAPRSESGIPVG